MFVLILHNLCVDSVPLHHSLVTPILLLLLLLLLCDICLASSSRIPCIVILVRLMHQVLFDR